MVERLALFPTYDMARIDRGFGEEEDSALIILRKTLSDGFWDGLVRGVREDICFWCTSFERLSCVVGIEGLLRLGWL